MLKLQYKNPRFLNRNNVIKVGFCPAPDSTGLFCDDTFGAMAELSTAALRSAGSIPTRIKIFVWRIDNCSVSGCLCM